VNKISVMDCPVCDDTHRTVTSQTWDCDVTAQDCDLTDTRQWHARHRTV